MVDLKIGWKECVATSYHITVRCTPFNQNAVPLFNDGLFRTEGSNFGFGVNRANAQGINNNSEASDQMFFRLLEFVIETSTGINLSDDNSQD